MPPAILVPSSCFPGGFFRRAAYLVIAFTTCLFVGCGSGGGSSTSSSGGSTEKGSYSISVSASTVDLTSSGPQTITVTVTPRGGYTGSVFVQISGLTMGVVASPSALTIPVAATGGSATVQLTTDQTALTGQTVVTVSANDGTLTASTSFQLNVTITPKIELVLIPASVSLTRGASQTVMLAMIGWGGLRGNVTGTIADLPPGVTAPPTFGGSLQGDAYLNFSATQTATTITGTATITVTGQGQTASIKLPVSVAADPDFSISSGQPNGVTTGQGSQTQFAVLANAVNGFSDPINISFSGLPAGVTLSPSTFSILPGTRQTVTMTTQLTATPAGDLQFKVQGAAGGLAHSYTQPLWIQEASVNYSLSPFTPMNATLDVPVGGVARIGVSLRGSGVLGTVQMTSDPTMPSGVTMSPASVTLPATGGYFDIYVKAQQQLKSPGEILLHFTYGPATSNFPVVINVTAPQNITPVPLRKASRFVRTDTAPPDGSTRRESPISPKALLYHSGTRRYFATDRALGRLNVVDAAGEKLLGYLSISGALAVDQSADGSTLYVGTRQGDVYVVDPARIIILQRFATSEIGAKGFLANEAYALADGTLLLMDLTHRVLARWNTQTNDLTWFQAQNQKLNVPTQPMCLFEPQNIFLSSDRKRAFVVDDGLATLNQVCSFDPVADTWTLSPQLNSSGPSAISALAQTPDGSRLIAYDGVTVSVLDAASMAVKSSFPASSPRNGTFQLSQSTMFAGADNARLFLPDSTAPTNLDVYDLATGLLSGWTPQPAFTQDLQSIVFPQYQTMTGDGVAAGLMVSGGIGLLDTTAVLPLPVGQIALASPLDSPYGPLAGGSDIWWYDVLYGQQKLGSVYFGDKPAAHIDMENGNIIAATPAGQQVGPVDVRAIFLDHSEMFMPDGFSYGPWILEAPTQYATAEGGGVAEVYGYGFGQQLQGTHPADQYGLVPNDLQVIVNGTPASLTGYDGSPWGLAIYDTTVPYFPQEAVQYKVPPGAQGSSAPIAVTNTAGATQAPAKLTYLPGMQNFPVDGALIDGVYDAHRDVYYFTDTNQVRVFSRTRGQWLAPIAVKPPVNPQGPQRLWGIALSPDGTRLAVADRGAAAVYLIDPDQPGSQIAYSLVSQVWVGETPVGVAVTNAGIVYLNMLSPNNDTRLRAVDPVNGTKPPLQSDFMTQFVGAEMGRIELSPDGTTAFLTEQATAYRLNLATGVAAQVVATCPFAATLPAETEMDATGTHILSTACLLDSNLNTLATPAMNRAELLMNSHLTGAAFSPHGGLLFQPGPQWIDVFEGNTGRFTARVSLGTPLSGA